MTQQTGQLFVISAPSGAGKTSLVRGLLAREPTLKFSISYTTRKMRATEQNGRDYYFVDHAVFERMAKAGDFLEHARVFDNFYGTSKSQVQSMLNRGEHVILEIDWQGAAQIRKAMPECRSVFILPPSRAELERRLRGRGTDGEDVIARRLRDSAGDLTHWDEFEFIVVNQDFEHALGELTAIVHGAGDHLQRTRPQVQALVATLLTGH